MDKERKARYAVFIGRFQPPHLAHIKIMKTALQHAEHLIVAVGSYNSSESVKNPWPYHVREKWIRDTLQKAGVSTIGKMNQITIIPVRDFIYNDTNWIMSLQNKIARIVGDEKVLLFGCFKDDSSYYLNYFHEWELVPQPNYKGISGTDIRENFFNDGMKWIDEVSPHMVDEMTKYKHDDKSTYLSHREELQFYKDYQKSWSGTPHPVNHVTVDCVIRCGGSVLVVKRGRNPGKGKIALPGGFVNTNEKIFHAAIRELKEETNIDLPKIILERAYKSNKIFDHPFRDPRGRTISIAHFFELDTSKPLPRVSGADDADEALWMPFSDLILEEPNIFLDHLGIIQYFLFKQ